MDDLRLHKLCASEGVCVCVCVCGRLCTNKYASSPIKRWLDSGVGFYTYAHSCILEWQ